MKIKDLKTAKENRLSKFFSTVEDKLKRLEGNLQFFTAFDRTKRGACFL